MWPAFRAIYLMARSHTIMYHTTADSFDANERPTDTAPGKIYDNVTLIKKNVHKGAKFLIFLVRCVSRLTLFDPFGNFWADLWKKRRKLRLHRLHGREKDATSALIISKRKY